MGSIIQNKTARNKTITITLLCGVLMACIGFWPAPANAATSACVQQNNQISLMGLGQPGGLIYARVSGHDNGCGCNEFRFHHLTTDTSKVLSILTAAKLAGKKVRIDLEVASNCNSAHKVYLQ